MTSPDTWIRLYRSLSRLYPEEYREEDGASMELTFAERLDDTRRRGGALSLTMFLSRELASVVVTALSAHVRARGWRGRRYWRKEFAPHWGDNPLNSIVQDIRYALRQLQKQPGFSLVVVITLALGIGSNTAIFSFLEGVLLRPLPYAESDRLMWVYDKYETWGPDGEAALSIPNFEDLRARSQLFEDLVAFQVRSFNVTGADQPTRVRGLHTSAGLLDLLRAQPQIGRSFLPTDDVEGALPVVILSDRVWRDTFNGDSDVLGRSITIDARPHTVVGVAPADFVFWGDPLVLIPFALPSSQKFRGARNVRVIGRLAADAAPEAAAAELDQVFTGIALEQPETNEGWSLHIKPFHERITGGTRDPLFILAGAVALVLLVACANVVNLLLARSEARRREFATRAALGASRFRLLRLAQTESLLYSIAGGLVGIVAAHWSVKLLVAVYGSAIPRSDEVAINGAVLGFTLVTSLVTGIAVGAVSASRVRSLDIHATLQEGAIVSPVERAWLKQALIVGEIALALMLATGAGLLLKSFWRLQQVDLGIRPENVLNVQLALPTARYQQQADVVRFYSSVMEELARNPRIARVGAINRFGLTHGYWNLTSVSEADDPENRTGHVEMRFVAGDYFAAMGIPLLQGRVFSESDGPDAPEVVMVNQEFARHLFAGRDPIGARINPRGPDRAIEIIGVVGDVREFGPDTWPRPTIYWHQSQTQHPDIRGSSLVLRTTEDPLHVTQDVRRTVLSLDADLPLFGVTAFSDLYSRSTGGRRFVMSVLCLFAGLALTLGAVGIYGLMSYSVAQRTRELGIRIALGGSHGAVIRMIVGRGVVLALLGVCAGLIGGFLALRLLQFLLFGVSVYDTATYAAGAGTLLLVAVVACYVPARRASAIDPLDALRFE